ncbi:DUF668 domain-containing protein/DUF3475 domain-containing protein [Heracleum sosnowskyi]|uniref:DUF668 domain-containing protein/DUF3475 domain-containing protein n=1 Tax=Heracleum sosnowskyi TaxID=360622 RepID=A0AAD8IVW0_9APIA|nr:DUF668 domain-containing protein/DUF3475 domain-containing protein [Heracleum sosnowskyi]
MGGFCSKKSTEDIVPTEELTHGNDNHTHGSDAISQTQGNNDSTLPSARESFDRSREPFSFPNVNAISYGMNADDNNDGIPRFSRVLSSNSRSTKSKQLTGAKVSEVGGILGRAGTVGLGKAVEVLDTLGSSMTNLNVSSNFVSGVATKGREMAILSFEVANTIMKGAKLMQSLSEESIRHLKEVVLPAEGVQRLISKDTEELLRIAASDKRDELKTFSKEVVRFGNHCKDPQWHNLDRYFEKSGSELTPQKQLKEEAETVMQRMLTLVQYTAELYHELHALDRFDQDYRHKLEEETSSSASQRGESLAILRTELKSQKKHVRSLKKKSLWSKILEEVMEKLVDIVHFLNTEIRNVFGSADGDRPAKNNHQKLGSAGLALHYANIITQIDTLVARPGFMPPNTRDALYHGLPPNIKSALRSKLQSFHLKEELTVPLIKAEMEKTLQWLVPMATNTTKAHHGFGWVGEWANAGSVVTKNPSSQTELIKIETLHHADKEKTETYILELILWLQHLISQSRKPSSQTPTLTVEDQAMLQDVTKRKLTPGISKSQEFDTTKIALSKYQRLSKSSSHSPTSEGHKDPYSAKRPLYVPVINFDIDKIKALDVIDRVDSVGSL